MTGLDVTECVKGSCGQIGSPQTLKLHLKPCQLAEKENYYGAPVDRNVGELDVLVSPDLSMHPMKETLADDLQQQKPILNKQTDNSNKADENESLRVGNESSLPPIPELNDEQLLADALSAVSLDGNEKEVEKGSRQNSSQVEELNEVNKKPAESAEPVKSGEIAPFSPKNGLDDALFRKSSPDVCMLPDAPAGCSALCEGKPFPPFVKNRRSKSVESLLTHVPLKKRNATNSKSCPPARSQPSPIKEVKKLLIKNDSDPNKKKENSHLNGKASPKKLTGRQQPLLRRPGQRESVASYFVKPVDVPVPGTTNDLEGPVAKDKAVSQVVDVDSWICAKEIKEQREAISCIRDAVMKWLPSIDERKLPIIEALALKFYLNIYSTICYFVTALKLLSKAPWTERMVSVDVRQSALVAIANGWCLNSTGEFCHPFSKAELAIAATLYEGAISPAIGEDVTHGLKVIIDKLPEVCEAFFTKANYVCPTCLASAMGQVHVFSTATTWLMDDWVNLRTELF